MNATLTREQAAEIRLVVDAEGWDGVRRRPGLWAAWQKSRAKDRQHLDSVMEFA